MVRKIALKIQKVEESLDTEKRKGRKSDNLPTDHYSPIMGVRDRFK